MVGPVRTLVLAAVLTLGAGGCLVVGPQPSPDPPADSQLVGCDQATEVVRLTASAHLDPTCTYTAGVRILASGVTLDCRGALIRGERAGTGIVVISPSDVDLQGVTIRDCRVEGFLNGIRITREGFRELAVGDEYTHVLSDVVVRDSTVSDTRGVGIFVDGYVTRVTLTGLLIARAGSAGIYLETGSRENTVSGNIIVDNGFVENSPSGSLREFGGITFAFWGTGREGIAVDGSSDNVIVNNFLHGNSAGGIFLYTNCGEYPGSGRYFERRYPADRNVIASNVLSGGWNGVWVGARMGENLLPMECSNPAFHEAPGIYYTLDRADDNVVIANHFLDTDYGVRVEDDGTRVIANRFTGPDAGHHAIVVGTPHRTTYLGQPVADTIVVGNRSEIVGNASPYRWVHGTDGLVDIDNTAAGGMTASMCEGVALPRNPFVMAVEVGLPNADGSIPAHDPIVLPVLGPIAPCPTG
jgi:parallel beta-helix repeat protein